MGDINPLGLGFVQTDADLVIGGELKSRREAGTDGPDQ
jgi:hypothetical protein